MEDKKSEIGQEEEKISEAMEEKVTEASKKVEDFTEEEFRVHMASTLDSKETVTPLSKDFFDRMPTLIFHPSKNLKGEDLPIVLLNKEGELVEGCVEYSVGSKVRNILLKRRSS